VHPSLLNDAVSLELDLVEIVDHLHRRQHPKRWRRGRGREHFPVHATMDVDVLAVAIRGRVVARLKQGSPVDGESRKARIDSNGGVILVSPEASHDFGDITSCPKVRRHVERAVRKRL
jgi:hypothetical protein